MQKELRIESLLFSNSKTYILATLFVVGNLLLPQLCHLVPQGGNTWLPIYFFTLVGACSFGWRLGLLTAVASPLLNCFLFGMPGVAVLPAILLKSVLLAGLAGYAATRFNKISLATLIAIVLGYQTIGTLGEWALVGNFTAACVDFQIGLPGMLLQIIGGWAVVRWIKR